MEFMGSLLDACASQLHNNNGVVWEPDEGGGVELSRRWKDGWHTSRYTLSWMYSGEKAPQEIYRICRSILFRSWCDGGSGRPLHSSFGCDFQQWVITLCVRVTQSHPPLPLPPCPWRLEGESGESRWRMPGEMFRLKELPKVKCNMPKLIRVMGCAGDMW